MLENPRLLFCICAVLLIHITLTACSESERPPQLESFAYGNATGHCPVGSRAGHAGAIDGNVSADGIRYMVRTPANYDATFAHPLLIVYAPAGQSRWGTERFVGLTTAATGAGFVVVYVDHRPLSVSTIEQLGAVPSLVAKKWCIDERKIYVTGHSDGGTASMMLATLDTTKQVPAAIAPSAAGVTGKDLEAFQCPAPKPVMIMHGQHDSLFPGWGAQTSAWWAGCNHCDLTKTTIVEGGCRAYHGCASGSATLYCEGSGGHRDWPNLNRVMLEFFTHPEKFQ